MSTSIKVADGIEIPVNSTTVLIAAAIGLSLLRSVFGFVTHMTDSLAGKEAPACYASFRYTDKFPAPEPLPDDAEKIALGTDRPLPQGVKVNEHGAPYLRSRVLDVQRDCRADSSCTGEVKDQYNSAILRYMLLRMEKSAWLERDYGTPGVKAALDAYSTAGDLMIEKGLMARVKAGVYKPETKATKEFVTILMSPERGRNFLQPCPSARKTLR